MKKIFTNAVPALSLLVVAVFAGFGLVSPVHAGNDLPEDAGEFGIEQPDFGIASIPSLISGLFNAALVLAVIFVFFMFIWGGYSWITAGGDKTKVEEARGRITNAVIGLAIVASAFALVTLIGTFFGVNWQNLDVLEFKPDTLNDTGTDDEGN